MAKSNKVFQISINLSSFVSVMNTMELIPELDYISKGLIEPVLKLVTGESWALAKDKFIIKVLIQNLTFLKLISE